MSKNLPFTLQFCQLVIMTHHSTTSLDDLASPQTPVGPQSPTKHQRALSEEEKSGVKTPNSDAKVFSSSGAGTLKKSNLLASTSGRLYKAIRRRSSMTLPPKRSHKPAANQFGTRKKKASLPAFNCASSDENNAGALDNSKSRAELKIPAGAALNYQRPLPPSPPPNPAMAHAAGPNTDACFPLREESSALPKDYQASETQQANATVQSTATGSSGEFRYHPEQNGELPILKEAQIPKASLSPESSDANSSRSALQESHESKTSAEATIQLPEQSMQDASSSQQSLNEEDTADAELLSISLREALKKYEHHFPLRLKIMQGYCSEDSEHNLSTDDVYDIHFAKQTRVITLRDNDGFTHRIPLASAMKFGLVYNPNNNYDEALAGYEFEKCSDIMAMESMPRIVCATTSIESAEQKHSIAQNEVIVVKSVQKPKLRGKKCLKVFSLLTNTEKVLPEECTGNFTTKPSLIRLHMPQIVQCFSNPFPTQAVLYVNANCPDLAEKLHVPLSGVITLCDCTTETSLVASPVVDENPDENLQQINLHLSNEMKQLEVQVISWKEDCGSCTIYDDTIPVRRIETSPCINVADLHDDAIFHRENTSLDDIKDVYDDILAAKDTPSPDDETYATVGIWRTTVPPYNTVGQQQMASEYDSVPVEFPEEELDSSHRFHFKNTMKQAFDSNM